MFEWIKARIFSKIMMNTTPHIYLTEKAIVFEHPDFRLTSHFKDVIWDKKKLSEHGTREDGPCGAKECADCPAECGDDSWVKGLLEEGGQ